MTPSSHPVIAIAARTSTNDWCRQLGVSHRQRDEAALHEARTLEARDRERRIALRRRWPTIAAAMRGLSHRYNEGAGHDVLTVIEDVGDERRDPTVQIVARGGQTLTMTLLGIDLCVRTTPSATGAADAGRRWITCGATDEVTAANALQHWLTQL